MHEETNARGCEECGWTGLHADKPTGDVETIERHDMCGVFAGDIDAARFYCYAHPRFAWIIYVDATNTVRWVDPHTTSADDDDELPTIGFAEPVYVATPSAAVDLAWDLVFGRTPRDQRAHGMSYRPTHEETTR